MYKVLIIGNATSIWLKEYIRNIHSDNEVTLLTLDRITFEEVNFYESIGVKLIAIGEKQGLLGKLSKTLKMVSLGIKLKGKFDIVDVEGPPHSSQATILSWFASRVGKRIVASFWGSDILRLPESGKGNLEKILKISHGLNLATDEMISVFRSFYGNSYDSKIMGAKFGSLAFSFIEQLRGVDKGYHRSQIGLEDSKLVVAVGHNGNEAQQHEKVINSLINLNEDYKEKIQLLVHMGYGVDVSYETKVRSLLDECGINYILNMNMLDLKEIASLRLATDVMIHGQTTDAMSGSIREILYSGALLVNPTWINYKEFDDNGVEYVKYDDFAELPAIVENIVDGEIKFDKDKNIYLLHQMSSWDSVKKDWERILYERVD